MTPAPKRIGRRPVVTEEQADRIRAVVEARRMLRRLPTNRELARELDLTEAQVAEFICRPPRAPRSSP